jgi:hypothetical protein
VDLGKTNIHISCDTKGRCLEKDWDSSLASPDRNDLRVTANHPRTASHLSPRVGVLEAAPLIREPQIQDDPLDLGSRESP